MPRSLNPYIAGNPVGNSDAFVGRADIVRDVLRIFSRSEENAIVLYGQCRIGKTSVLQYLKNTFSQDKSRLYYPVYFDLQDKADWSLDAVLKDLAATIANELGFQTPQLDDNPQHTFQHEWLPQKLTEMQKGSALVLLFDEFDVLASDKVEAASSRFFPYLRQLIASDREHINFVFVIGRNVDDLNAIALSLFKGIPTRRVSLLNRADTFELIRLSEKNSPLRWSDEALEEIWKLTNGHAFFTQQLCSYAWEEAYSDGDFESDVITPDVINNVVDDVLDASRNTLEWLWDGLPPAERVVSSALAEKGGAAVSERELETLLHESGVRIVIRELQDAPRLLQEWDLLEPVNGGFRFRVELLRRWLVDNKPLRRVQDELDRIEPVAESLFQAAQGLYRNGQLEQAEAPVRQAIGLNPNHVGANELLADLLLGQDKYEEAKNILISLYEYQPMAARSRLVQAWLGKSTLAETDDDTLQYYEKILEIDPNQVEAKKGYEIIWVTRGDQALKEKRFSDALDAYNNANQSEKVFEVNQIIQEVEANNLLNKLSTLKKEKKYKEALKFSKLLETKFPSLQDWKKEIKEIQRLLTITIHYQQAMNEFKLGNRKQSQELLVKAICIDPEFEQAAYYLFLTVNEEKFNKTYRIKNIQQYSNKELKIMVILVVCSTYILIPLLSKTSGTIAALSGVYFLLPTLSFYGKENLLYQEHFFFSFYSLIPYMG